MADKDEPTQRELIEASVAAAMATVAGGGVQDELLPIGVPEGFVARLPEGRPGFGADHADEWRDVPPRYVDTYQFMPANLPPAEREKIQMRMVAAGLIGPGTTYLNGTWDDVSINAFTSLLSLSNRSGMTWEQQLGVLENTQVANRPQFSATPYLRSDPATVRQSVRGLMREMIGEDREPTGDELGRLTAVFESFSQQAYAAQASAEEAAFNAEQDGVAPPAVLQDVDPSARFQEYLQNQYAPEIRSREGVVDMTAARQGFLSNVFATQEAVLS